MDKRTTVVLDEEDQETLTKLATLMKTSEMEVIRRSIRLAARIMRWREEGKLISLIVGPQERWRQESVTIDPDASSMVITQEDFDPAAAISLLEP